MVSCQTHVDRNSPDEYDLSATGRTRRARVAVLSRRLLQPPILAQHASDDVRQLLALIHVRLFDGGVTVKLLRHSSGLRDHNVSSRFKREMGVSISDYVLGLRMRVASELLRTTSWPVAEVSYSVGYDYLQTFYRAFHKAMGVTPGQWRSEENRAGAA